MWEVLEKIDKHSEGNTATTRGLLARAHLSSVSLNHTSTALTTNTRESKAKLLASIGLMPFTK